MIRLILNEDIVDKKDNPALKYSINLSFQEIKLPPFQDILVLAKNSSHGKRGLYKSFELLVPNGFDIIEVEYVVVQNAVNCADSVRFYCNIHVVEHCFNVANSVCVL